MGTLLVAATLALGPLLPVAAGATHVQSDVDTVLAPGATATLRSTVPTHVVPPDPDVMLLADTTGSMAAPIGAIRRDAAHLLSAVRDAQPSVRFGVAEYRDLRVDRTAFRVDRPLTGSPGAAAAGIRRWVAAGGGDAPEDGLNALYRLATTDSGFDRAGSRTVVWVGDAPSHEPSGGHTLERTIAVLRTAGIRVIALDAGDLDRSGQAGRIAAATGGVLLHDSAGLAAAILSGVHPARVTVTPKLVRCDRELTLGLSPPHRRVPGGREASFHERVAVAAGAEPGEYRCQVRYLVDGRVYGDPDTTTVRVRGIGIDDVRVTEGTGGRTTAVFTVNLTGAATGPVSVGYSTAAGGAAIPADLAAASGRITFPPGTSTRRVAVRIVPDALDEPREVFTVNLSGPRGAGLADAVGIGTIVDDD